MWPVYMKYQAMNAIKVFLYLILKEICDTDIICVDVDENNSRDIARAIDNHRGLHHLNSSTNASHTKNNKSALSHPLGP